MQGLVPTPPFSREAVRSPGVVACCSDCSSIHNLDCSDHSDYCVTLGLDSDSDSDSCYSHTDPAAVTDSD